MSRLFKVLDFDGLSCNGGNAIWHLPKGERPGKWMPSIKRDLRPCYNGYHLCREGDLIDWLGPEIWEAEYRGKIIEDDNKVVVRNVRLIRQMSYWNDCTARLFACWCAESVLHLYEKRYPNDSRVRDCIEAAKKVAKGDLPIEALDAPRTAARANANATASASVLTAVNTAICAINNSAIVAAKAAASYSAHAALSAAASLAQGEAVIAASKTAHTKVIIHLIETGELPGETP